MSGTPTASTRRDFMMLSAALVMLPLPVLATPQQVSDEIKKLYGDKKVVEGKIKLDLPSIAENGLVVPLNFEVESPMTEKDYVKAVHLFADGNPLPQVASFYFTPMAPKAAASIRIRLAQTPEHRRGRRDGDGELYTAQRGSEGDDRRLRRLAGVGTNPIHRSIIEEIQHGRPLLPAYACPPPPRPARSIEVKTLISHEMETGQRKDAAGKPIPRKIIKQFTATFNGKEIFRSRLASVGFCQSLSVVLRAGAGDRHVRVLVGRRRRLRLQVRAEGRQSAEDGRRLRLTQGSTRLRRCRERTRHVSGCLAGRRNGSDCQRGAFDDLAA